jgi:hypothetical protein
LVVTKGMRHQPISGRVAGTRAVDETPEQEAARRAEERRAYFKELSQRRRRDEGVTARCDSIERTKPWEAEGISRRTWYYRRKKAKEAKGSPPEVAACTNSVAHKQGKTV